MSAPIPLRRDFGASQLRGLAKKTKDGLIERILVHDALAPLVEALCSRYGIPTIFQFREFAAAGGLMSYGGGIADPNWQFGVYTGRALKGEKPADLPVHSPRKWS